MTKEEQEKTKTIIVGVSMITLIVGFIATMAGAWIKLGPAAMLLVGGVLLLLLGGWLVSVFMDAP